MRSLQLLALAGALCRQTAAQGVPSDDDCGDALVALSTMQPNVLLVGDSISMVPPVFTPGGYGAAAHALLAAQGVSVQHAGGWAGGGQCSNTRKGLLCTNSSQPRNYLAIPGGGVFDVVHVNYGLHDLAAPCPPGTKGECEEHVDVDVYAVQLVEVWRRLSTVAKTMIWTTTTPAPNIAGVALNRTYANVVLYNAAALAALTSAVAPAPLRVNDLWKAMIDVCGAGYAHCALQRPVDVHLTPAGINVTAASVVASVLAALAPAGGGGALPVASA